MSKALITLAATIALASAQSPITLQPSPAVTSPSLTSIPGRPVEASRPLLGYLTNDSNVIYSVVGSAGHASWDEPLALPDGTAAAFLPPRQEYALLASEAGLSLARLSRSTVYPGEVIPDAMPRPEQVAFSPSGTAAALFSSAESRIQIVTYIAGQAQVLSNVPLASADKLLRFTISDDGALLVAAFQNQPARYSLQGAAWQLLATNYRPDAWTFLPASHDLVLSDRTQKAIVVLPQAERAPINERVLASGGIDATLLAPNKQGNELLAVAVGTSDSWSIDLTSGAVTKLAAKDTINSLTLLRDGQTFLVSIKESPGVVKLSGNAAQSAATNISR